MRVKQVSSCCFSPRCRLPLHYLKSFLRAPLAISVAPRHHLENVPSLSRGWGRWGWARRVWEQSVLWEGYSRRSNLYRHARAHIHACLRHILVLIPDVIGTDGILAGSRVGDFSRRGHPPSGRCTTSPVQQQLMRRPRHLAGLRLSGGFGATPTLLRRFTYSSNPSWLALSDGRGLCALDAVVFWLRSAIAISSWYGQAISGSFAASRFTALIVVERRLVAYSSRWSGSFDCRHRCSGSG